MKGEAYGYQSFILHLAPANSAGLSKSMCPYASAGCTAACLNTAGRGVYPNVQAARVRKTRLFDNDRQIFMSMLVKDIVSAIRRATRNALIPCIRLNGTSDVMWERFPVQQYMNIMEMFPDVQFYDYTKIPPLWRTNRPKNYHLTFSLSENNGNMLNPAIQAGMNVAVVFRKYLPNTFQGYDVINGDITDLRFLDRPGVVVGLGAKGRARRDTSGFVREG